MRLFIAIDVSKEAHEYLLDLHKQLPNVSQSLATSFHLTLKFLGEVADAKQIQQKLSKVKFKLFELSLSEIEFFPSAKHPRVVWVGVKPQEQVLALQKQVDDALKEFFEVEKDFVPHLTLARIKELKKYDVNIKVKPLSFNIDSFVLYESKLSPKGASYEVIEEYKA